MNELPPRPVVSSRQHWEADPGLSFDAASDVGVPIEQSPPEFASELSAMVAHFSLGWLVAANLVGVWMALLLVKPELERALGEYSYGRWEPLHLDWQLYGWCALPLVGVLLSFFLRPGAAALKHAHWALVAWSAALVAGGVSWLHGQTTGKLFLDWNGFARATLIGAQTFLWCVLAANWWRARGRTRRTFIVTALLLVALAGVPLALLWATHREGYPAIDPGTGGPTGASLLGSTLGVVLIFSLVPKLLRLRGPDPYLERRHWVCVAMSIAVFALLDQHQSSHHDWRQIAGLATLLVWIPLLAIYLRGFRWNEGSRSWLSAMLVWWSLLVFTGFLQFCPGILERTKFTHALVAHAHLAMAGLLTSFNMLVLSNLGPSSGRLAKQAPFALWQAGLAGHLLALAALAAFEAGDPGWLFHRSSVAGALYLARLGAGMVMTAASLWWLAEVNRTRRAEAPVPA